MKLPYTGSGVMAAALAMDKWRSKLVWAAAGLPVPDFAVLEAGSDFAAVAARLGLPLFVKPVNEGSSIGISKVKAASELPAAYELAARYDKLVLAERAVDAGEYTVGILADQALPVIRIQPATEFYDYEAKYSRDDTKYLIPSGLSPQQERDMQALALAAFAVLGGRGWGRVDILCDANGKAWCLEANMAPGMTDHSLVPMAAKAAGIGFDDLVLRILGEATCGLPGSPTGSGTLRHPFGRFHGGQQTLVSVGAPLNG
jgi:D-alanine-D-alanine ligase